MTATHSHGSPFALVEGALCSVLFGSATPAHEDQHQHHHEPSQHAQHEPPDKSREELNEGTRKRKAKKAE